ncbi:MAG: hypothetical protein AB8G15_01860 [Saprospiraceae bacterium]
MMIRKYCYLLFCLLCLGLACTEETSTASQTNTTTTEKPSAPQIDRKATKPDCQVGGTFLEGNELWLKEQNRLLYILADSTTLDQDLGESHRVLAIYNSTDCSLIDRQVLPIDESADFPYYIAEINYNNLSQLVAIKGARTIYCYDLQGEKLLKVLRPNFKNKRLVADTSAGMINRLEVWENYLIGYAEQYGAFVFKLEKGGNPRAILPAAEYALGENNFSSLFLLASAGGEYQAIIPSYDYEAEKFKINPLFQVGKTIDSNIPSNIQDNRFLILKEKGNRTPIAIDMRAQIAVDLPAKMQAEKTKVVLEWLQRTQK